MCVVYEYRVYRIDGWTFHSMSLSDLYEFLYMVFFTSVSKHCSLLYLLAEEETTTSNATNDKIENEISNVCKFVCRFFESIFKHKPYAEMQKKEHKRMMNKLKTKKEKTSFSIHFVNF